MIKLNDSNVFIGHIKQVLKNFNLPNCPIGESNKEANKHYIENNKIYLYKYEKNDEGEVVIDKSIDVQDYIYGSFYPNLTSNLKLENNLYDRYTHRYLGKYLRFLRDYKKVDLMSMYNCFDREVFESSFNINLSESEKQDSESKKQDFHKNFTSDENNIVYTIPVMLNKLYLIKTISDYPLEGCLTINDENLKTDEDKLNLLYKIAKKSYFKRTYYDQAQLLDLFINIKDEDPVINGKIKNLIQQYNQKLILLLKVPSSLEASIVLLEQESELNSNLNTNPQLFNYINDDNYLLADKLIEYLTGNVICPLSQAYDIEKVQRCLNNLPYLQGDSSTFEYYGKWSEFDTGRIIYFSWINKLYDKYFDLLGYCDKDIEKELNIAYSQWYNDTKTGGIV